MLVLNQLDIGKYDEQFGTKNLSKYEHLIGKWLM